MTHELVTIQPGELKFPFELEKQISCSLQVMNNMENYVAFKIKTSSPKKYCVQPNRGIVSPKATCDVIVTMQALRVAPRDMLCKDKFLVETVIAPSGTTINDITPEMFNNEPGKVIEQKKLGVVYVAPPELSEEEDSSLGNSSPSVPSVDHVQKDISELKATLSEVQKDISELKATLSKVPKDIGELKAMSPQRRCAKRGEKTTVVLSDEEFPTDDSEHEEEAMVRIPAAHNQQFEEPMHMVMEGCKEVMHIPTLCSIIRNMTHNYVNMKELIAASRRVSQMAARNMEEADEYLADMLRQINALKGMKAIMEGNMQ